MNEQTHRHKRRGFTLIEILVVIAIIVVLAGMIAPKLLRHVGKAKQSVAKNNIIAIENAVNIFSLTYERLPDKLDELVNRPAYIEEADWNSPTLKAKNLLDPWGKEYIYRQPGEHGAFDLYSLGKDGQEGGEKENANITNW